MTGLPSTLGLYEGEAIVGAGIPAGTSIAAINSTTSITLSQAATTDGSSSLTFVSNDTSLAATLDGTNVVSDLSSTVGLYDGELVTGAGIPAGTTISRITSASSVTLSQSATASGATVLLLPKSYDLSNYVFVVGQTSGTLTVFSRDPATNVLTWLQTLENGVNGVRGLADATDVAVSQNGQYVYATSGQGNSVAEFGAQSDGTLVVEQVLHGSLGIGKPAAIAVDPTTGDVYVASQAGSRGGGLASFTQSSGSTAPNSQSITYNNMQQLTVQVGNSDSQISEASHALVGAAPAAAAQLYIVAGDGDDTINLLDIASTALVVGNITSTTAVSVGAGANDITVNAANNSTTLTINPAPADGGGNNFVELDAAAASDKITINLGSGNSEAQVDGSALNQSAIVTVNGGSGYDTLLFDAKGNPINAYTALGAPIPGGQPAIPDGQIQDSNGAPARLTYTQISEIPGFVGAVVSAGGPYAITEGEGVTLSGTATAATGSTIESYAWFISGVTAGSGGLSAKNLTLTWDLLVALGFNAPGTYPIALQVHSNTNTVTAYSSLTIAAVPPVLAIDGCADRHGGHALYDQLLWNGGPGRELRNHRLDDRLG